MMPFITMLVPYRETEDRKRTWDFLKSKWEARLSGHGLADIIEQDSDTKEWNKPIAIARGIQRIYTDYVAIVDADVWIEGLEQTFDYLRKQPVPYLLPHRRLYRLNAQYTSWILRGRIDFSTLKSGVSNIHLDESHKKAMPGGGCVIVRKSTLRRFVPFDPRHPSWGNEDRDWYFAMSTLVGTPIQFNLPLFHFYHQKQVRIEREFGSEYDKELHLLYKAAYQKPEQMLDIINGAHAAIRERIPSW